MEEEGGCLCMCEYLFFHKIMKTNMKGNPATDPLGEDNKTHFFIKNVLSSFLYEA